jgi:hypothetical protein
MQQWIRNIGGRCINGNRAGVAGEEIRRGWDGTKKMYDAAHLPEKPRTAPPQGIRLHSLPHFVVGNFSALLGDAAGAQAVFFRLR